MSQYFRGPLSVTLSTESGSALSGLITRERGPEFTTQCCSFSEFGIVFRIINLANQLRKNIKTVFARIFYRINNSKLIYLNTESKMLMF